MEMVRPEATEYYFRFQIQSQAELAELTRLISIDRVDNLTVTAYANRAELERFQQMGYIFEILPHPSSQRQPQMAMHREEMTNWDRYPSWQTYTEMMRSYARDYPHLCLLDTIGYSVNGRPLLVVKISDQVEVSETEPAVFLTATMHGDEPVGYVLLLRLISYLLVNYAYDERVHTLLDNIAIWINPLANPDGTYRQSELSVYGATRYNANNVDLNRNFPDPAEGENPDGKAYQPETRAMMAFAGKHQFILSANFHGGAEVINYPWDTWQRLHPDDAWFQKISSDYVQCLRQIAPADYFTDVSPTGITNGYAWYRVVGGRQDYMLYFRRCREVTIELSRYKIPVESSLPLYWEYNREALLGFLEQALSGLYGQVTDKLGHPLPAEICILNHDTPADHSSVFANRSTGEYYRLCLPGEYVLKAVLPPFEPLQNFWSFVSKRSNLDLVFDAFAIGDLDENDKLDLSDLVNLLRISRQSAVLDSLTRRLADWNNDEQVNQKDWQDFMQYLLNAGKK